jgi:hypothetical protein
MMVGIEIARKAREQLKDLTGLAADTISSMVKVGEGWEVSIEMLEMRRIPDSTDILGTYQVSLDADGGLITYRRTRRYRRDDALEEA